MAHRHAFLLAGFWTVAVATAAFAAEQSGCAAFKWPVDRESAAFAAAGIPTVNAGAALPGVDAASTLKLAVQAGQSFEVTPSHKPRNDPAYAGSFTIAAVPVAGSYQVTLSDAGWIDVVQQGKLLRQNGFSGREDCPAVRKSVRFDLSKGPATIVISDAPKDTLKLDMLPSAGP